MQFGNRNTNIYAPTVFQRTEKHRYVEGVLRDPRAMGRGGRVVITSSQGEACGHEHPRRSSGEPQNIWWAKGHWSGGDTAAEEQLRNGLEPQADCCRVTGLLPTTLPDTLWGEADSRTLLLSRCMIQSPIRNLRDENLKQLSNLRGSRVQKTNKQTQKTNKKTSASFLLPAPRQPPRLTRLRTRAATDTRGHT